MIVREVSLYFILLCQNVVNIGVIMLNFSILIVANIGVIMSSVSMLSVIIPYSIRANCC